LIFSEVTIREAPKTAKTTENAVLCAFAAAVKIHHRYA
jgi:hypothetical protein